MSQLTLIRHAESYLNFTDRIATNSDLYQKFVREYEADPDSKSTRKKAAELKKVYGTNVADQKIHLTPEGKRQAQKTGVVLQEIIEPPEVVFVSPYVRACQTFAVMQTFWPLLGSESAPYLPAQAMREQSTGDAHEYGTFGAFRVFFALNPEERLRRERDGMYYYKFPRGENVPELLDRVQMFLERINREFAGKNILVISHFTVILAVRAVLEWWDETTFLEYVSNKSQKPVNCGVSVFETQGEGERFKNTVFNKKLYEFNEKLN